MSTLAVPVPGVSDLIPAQADAIPAQEAASRGSRLIAQCIDEALMAMAGIPGLVIFSVPASSLRMPVSLTDGMESPSAVAAFLLFVVIAGSLSTVQFQMLKRSGQTIGKRLVGVRIVRAADGGRADLRQVALFRNIVPVMIRRIPVLGLVFDIADLLFIFRTDRRCLHDLMAGTKVVKA